MHSWIEAYARPTQTRDEANAALAAMPEMHPLLDLFRLRPYDAEPIGRTLALAGRLDEAVPYLAASTYSCNVLDGADATYMMWAALDLGHALEERSDVPGACTAYNRVLAHWGGSRPQAQTATKALRRKTALGCAP